MQFQRSHRVGEQIQKEISALLLKGLKDPRIGFVTITAVKVTADLGQARIFFSVMGNEDVRKQTTQGLTSATPFMRRELGKRLRMRHVPELIFEFDTALEYGNRIESLLQEIKQKEEHD
ncbi:MAG: 30S ribosome-binding factor RbfA [Syntrophotaleaceae bacterium]